MGRSGLQVLDKVFDLLDSFSAERPQLTGPQLLTRTGVTKSTGYRLLGFLVERGLLNYDPAEKLYRPGGRLLFLGSLAIGHSDVRQLAVPIMRRLRDETGESVNISLAQGGDRVCVEKVESLNDLREIVEVGRHSPLHLGATGKCLLAFMSPEQYSDWRAGFHVEGFDLGRLEAELVLVRERRVAVSYSERVQGAAAVSAPIFDHTSKCLVVLTVSGPEMRFSNREATLCDLTLAAGLAISRQLGYKS